MKKKRILFIAHTGGKAGAETVLAETIAIVARSTNHLVYVAIPNSGDRRFADLLRCECVENISYFKYRVARKNSFLFIRNMTYSILFGLPSLYRYCLKYKIDTIYVNSSVNLIGVLLGCICRIPVIWHIHEQPTKYSRWTPSWIRPLYRKWIMSPLVKSIFVSKKCLSDWLDDLHLSSIPQAIVLYSSYKVISSLQKEEHQFTIGYIGGLTANKNVKSLIRAFIRLNRPDWRLLIAGSGECESEFKHEAAGYDNILFMGAVSPAENFYSQIDILVQPSFNESWGLVALEAVQCRIPVIMTWHTGLTEIFEDQKHFLYFDPCDTNQLVKLLQSSYNNVSLQSMSERAVNRLNTLRLNRVYSDTIISLIAHV